MAFIQQCDRCTATVRAWRDWGQWLIIRAERVAHRWELCCKHCTYTHSSQCCRWSEHAVIIDTPGELCLSLSVTCTARELADRRHAAGHCYTRRTIVKIGPLFRDRPVIIAWWRWRAGGSAKRDTVCQLSSIYARDKFPCHLPCIAACCRTSSLTCAVMHFRRAGAAYDRVTCVSVHSTDLIVDIHHAR